MVRFLYNSACLLACLPAIGCVVSPSSGESVTTTSSSLTFTGFTWSAQDTIQFYPWVSTTTDGYPVGEGDWYTTFGLLFTATSNSTPTASRFNTDLYAWTTTASIPYYFWEDGFSGSQVYLKARSKDRAYALMSFDPDTDWYDCLGQSSGWFDYMEDCGGRDSPAIRIETDDFIPWVDRAMVDCDYRGNDCTQCVPDVLAELTGLFRGQQANPKFELDLTPDPPPTSSVYNHFQGIARLSNFDIGGGYSPGGYQPIVGRLALSRDRPPQLYIVAEETRAAMGEPEFTADIGSLYATVDIDTELDHPGGLWAANNLVAVPIECSDDCTTSYNEIIFYRADGFDLSEVNRLVLDGSQGESFVSPLAAPS